MGAAGAAIPSSASAARTPFDRQTGDGCCPVVAQIAAVSWLDAATMAWPAGGAWGVAAVRAGAGGAATWSTIWACDKPVSSAGLNAEVVVKKTPPTIASDLR